MVMRLHSRAGLPVECQLLSCSGLNGVFCKKEKKKDKSTS